MTDTEIVAAFKKVEAKLIELQNGHNTQLIQLKAANARIDAVSAKLDKLIADIQRG